VDRRRGAGVGPGVLRAGRLPRQWRTVRAGLALERTAPEPHDVYVDVGAGLGGPAGYAQQRTAAAALLIEPQRAACRAARAMFGLAGIQAHVAALPLPTASVDVAWSLGVFDTMPDHRGALRELARVLRPTGRIGLLIYARAGLVIDAPEGNDYPHRDRLPELFDEAGLAAVGRALLIELGAAPPDWTQRSDAVDAAIQRRHGDSAAWRLAAKQERAVRRLLDEGTVVGELFHLAGRRL
jgi:SAM-dependent methyltransferase